MLTQQINSKPDPCYNSPQKAYNTNANTLKSHQLLQKQTTVIIVYTTHNSTNTNVHSKQTFHEKSSGNILFRNQNPTTIPQGNYSCLVF